MSDAAMVTQPQLAIYAPPSRALRLGVYGRVIALAVAAGCAILIVTAFRLRPSPDGVGTHQGMGFLPCTMLVTTGIPCPTCGMTTSFAWFFKGNILASFYVQPGGFALAWGTGVVLLWSLYEVVTGRPIHRLARYIPPKVWIIGGSLALAFSWGWKIIIHLCGVDGW